MKEFIEAVIVITIPIIGGTCISLVVNYICEIMGWFK